MISHELRSKPIPLCIALCLLGSCEVHETAFTQADEISVKRGSAVSAWSDAQLVVRPDHAAARNSATGDAAIEDAAAVDARVGDAASSDAASLDAAPTTDAASADDITSGIDARCAFRVTTLSLGGRYTPKNIGAIWIERADGTWVKTLQIWAGVRLRYLTNYRRANPAGNKLDAVTSATVAMFGSHVVGWNLKDAQGNEVPDGQYAVKVEVTDRDATGQTFALPFTKTSPPFNATLPDTQYFSSVVLRCR